MTTKPICALALVTLLGACSVPAVSPHILASRATTDVLSFGAPQMPLRADGWFAGGNPADSYSQRARLSLF